MRSVRPSAASLVAAVAALWVIVLAGAARGTSAGDPRGLYVLGARFAHPPELDGVRRWDGTGYDGQFFAALAVDPLLLDANTPRYLDGPAYRAGRIGLPLAAWIVALGNRRAALIVYPLLTWALSLLGIWVAARWLEEDGRAVLWAAPLALSVGMVSSMLRCLPDAAAASLLLLALWLDRRGRPGSIAALSFAALVRETSLIGAAVFAGVRWRRGERREAALALAIPAGLGLQPPWIRPVSARRLRVAPALGGSTGSGWLPARTYPPVSRSWRSSRCRVRGWPWPGPTPDSLPRRSC